MTTIKSIPNSMRTAALETKYQQDKKNGKTKDLLDEPAIKEWNGWRLIENAYPYDLVFKKHHMLIPILDVTQALGLETPSLRRILKELEADYDLWFVNMPHRQSIKSLFHVHLVCYRDREEIENA